MTRYLFVTVMVALVPALQADEKSAGDAAKDELKAVQGTWKVVSIESEGKAWQAAEIEGAQMTISEDKYTYKQGNMTEEGSFKLDPTKKPKAITLMISSGNDQGKTQLGIYALEGGKLKVCVSTAGSDKRPTDFTSKQGNEQTVFVLQRDKP